MKLLSEFDTLLMHINLDTRSHIFLKINIFYQKKTITFSSSAHLIKKSTFLPKFHFFFFFFAQNWHFCTKINIDRITCHFPSKFARNYSITVLKKSHICPKTDVFCIKCDFFAKRKQRHHFQRKWWPFATEKILQNWCFCMIFAFNKL